MRKGNIFIPLAAIVLALMAFSTAVYFGYGLWKDQQDDTVTACTDEAKLCPDGSAVGRTGPKCEFAACPGESTTNEAVYCAQDVKTCDDGSFVARQAPNCEFASCPDATSKTMATYSAAEIVADPTRFDNQTACVKGWYQSSFEFTAFAANTTKDAAGHVVPKEPFINVYDSPDSSTLTCTDNERATRSCAGEITHCGRLRYAGPGEKGYGASETMRWQLEPLTLAPDS